MPTAPTFLNICGYSFEGPFTSYVQLRHTGGVYVPVTRSASTEKWQVLDVGQAQDIHIRHKPKHDRSGCWARHSAGSIALAVHYTPGKSEEYRRKIEREIRQQYDPPCGER